MLMISGTQECLETSKQSDNCMIIRQYDETPPNIKLILS